MSTTPAARPAKGRSRIAAWADHHSWSIVASLGRMLRRPWATLLTVGVMGVALALPLGLWLVLDNAARLAGVDDVDRELLLAHRIPGVQGTYLHVPALFTRLLASQEKISAWMLAHTRPTEPAKPIE